MTNHSMVLLNIVGTDCVSGQVKSTLANIHIAGVWMDNENESDYEWVLECFKECVFPASSTIELPNVFVTDNDKPLKKALDKSFPQSDKLLCYVYIMRRFQVHGLSKLTSLYSTEENKKYEKREIAQLASDIALSANTRQHLNVAIVKYKAYSKL
ncbi:hypothetical protein BCV72DRAFT_240561 [Rhizopus microsporus var. microsporus]|uniref:MULE transposase domain-containing protein n=1 Tax=Rhizopus microsporus var. microsporus TaxID=86635 RepID=A0A1X0R8S2_RHIZD|nr:hypothetical protein BCV72DRAFT_240561 [Rhizopus microsporus var. microsporus]